MVGEMCRVQLKDRKRIKDFMLMLGLNEAVDHLAMENQFIVMVMCRGGRMVMS